MSLFKGSPRDASIDIKAVLKMPFTGEAAPVSCPAPPSWRKQFGRRLDCWPGTLASCAAHIGFVFSLDPSEGALGRLDKKRGLVCSAHVWDVGHIDQQREFGAVCFRLWQAKSEAAPATVGGESFFCVPLGFLDKAREGEEGL